MPRSNAAVADAPEEQPRAAARRKPLEIDPRMVSENFAGINSRWLFIRLPQEMTAADLSDPTIWRKVQISKSLRKFDELRLVAYDESWICDVTVLDADGAKAVLGKPRIQQMPQRYDRLLEDENYRLEWMGLGYVTVRKSDGQRVTQPAPTIPLAEREFKNLYPSRA